MNALEGAISTIREITERQKDYLELEKRPGWSQMKDGVYFDRLLGRFKEAEAWARETRPRLTYIGDWHRAPGQQYANQDVILVHRRRHEWIYGVLKELLTEPLLVAIEAYGPDGILDQAKYITMARNDRLFIGEKPFSFKEAQAYLDVTKPPAWAYMKTKKDVRFVCGEEWPLRMHYSLVLTWNKKFGKGAMVPKKQGEDFDTLLPAFRALRSTIMVVRTLEWLKKTGRRHGVMEQGSGHRLDIEELARDLGVELGVRIMPPMELELA